MMNLNFLHWLSGIVLACVLHIALLNTFFLPKSQPILIKNHHSQGALKIGYARLPTPPSPVATSPQPKPQKIIKPKPQKKPRVKRKIKKKVKTKPKTKKIGKTKLKIKKPPRGTQSTLSSSASSTSSTSFSSIQHTKTTQSNRSTGDTQANHNQKTSAKPDPSVLRGYKKKLQRWLTRHKRYPKRALRRGIQGKGLIKLRINRQGRVLSYKLIKGTGSSILDREINAMVRRATPLPAIPNALGLSDMEIRVPVNFDIRLN